MLGNSPGGSSLTPERRQELLERSRRLRQEHTQRTLREEELAGRCSMLEAELTRLRQSEYENAQMSDDRASVVAHLTLLRQERDIALQLVSSFGEHVGILASFHTECCVMKQRLLESDRPKCLWNSVPRGVEDSYEERLAVLRHQVSQYVAEERLWREERQRHVAFQTKQEEEMSELREVVDNLREALAAQPRVTVPMTPIEEVPLTPLETGHGIDMPLTAPHVIDQPAECVPPPRLEGHKNFNFVTVRVLGGLWRWLSGRRPVLELRIPSAHPKGAQSSLSNTPRVSPPSTPTIIATDQTRERVDVSFSVPSVILGR